MNESFDAVVVGAGPAGTSAAFELGRAGHRVLIIDKEKFPRDKTCGDGLTYKCREPMQRMGVWDKFLDAVEFRADGYTLVLTDLVEMMFRSPDENPLASVYVLPRRRLDQILLENATSQGDVTFIDDTKIKKLLMEDRNGHSVAVGVEGSDANGQPVSYLGKIVIDATGVNSPIAVDIGMGNQDSGKCAVAIRGYYSGVSGLNNTIEIYFDDAIQPGYFWIFPTSDGSANVGCGTFQHILQSTKTKLHDVMDHFCNHHKIAGPKLRDAKLCGQLQGGKIPLAIDQHGSRVRDGLILLGDAGAFVNPITGEGISYAMNSGLLAGETAANALQQDDVSKATLSPFDEAWQAKFASQFEKAALVTEGIPAEHFSRFLLEEVVGAGLGKSKRLEKAKQEPGLQYEFLMALKSIVKFLQ